MSVSGQIDPLDAAFARSWTTSLGAAHGRQTLRSELFGGQQPRLEIGRYRLLAELGRGGGGSVYRAHDPRLRRDIALKLIELARGGNAERAIGEARVLASLEIEGVVEVLDAGPYEVIVGSAVHRGVYLAMPILPGRPLERWIRESRPSWRHVVTTMRQGAQALAAVHAHGVVHGDIKPSNIVVLDDGSPTLIDFGLAIREEGRSQARTPTARPGQRVAGTFGYIAPERLAGAPMSPHTDQYGFCVSLERVLALTPGAPRRVWRVARRGSARRPTERFDSMESLVSALDRVLRPLRPGRPLIFASGAAALLVAYHGVSKPCETSPPSNERRELRKRVLGSLVGQRGMVESQLAAFEAQSTEVWRRSCSMGQDRGTAIRACLDAQQSEVDAVLRAAERDRPARASASILVAIPEPRRCGDRRRLYPVGPDPRTVADVESIRADLAASVLRWNAGDGEAAQATADRALMVAQRIGYAPLLAEAYAVRGQLETLDEPLPDDSVHALERAWALGVESSHPVPAVRAALNLAAAAVNDKDADRWLEYAAALIERFDRPPALVVEFHVTRARRRLRVDDLAGAVADWQAAIDLADRPSVAANARVRLAEVRYRQGRLGDARALASQGATQLLEGLGPGAAALTDAFSVLSNVASLEGDAELAVELAQQAVDYAVMRHGDEHPLVWVRIANLGMMNALAGDARTGRDRVREAVSRMRDDPPPRAAAHVLSTLGSLEAELGDLEAALASYERARVYHESSTTKSSKVELAMLQSMIARILQQLGREREAIVRAEDAAATLRSLLGHDHPTTRFVQDWLEQIRTGVVESLDYGAYFD